jgi:hypothetical protein
MAKFFNRVRMAVSGAAGAGTVTLAAAFSVAYCTFAESGVANGDVVSYFIEDGNNFEIGIGTYTSAGTTLSRDTIRLSKSGGVSGTAKLTLTASAVVYLSPAKEDMISMSEATVPFSPIINTDLKLSNALVPTASFIPGININTVASGTPTTGFNMNVLNISADTADAGTAFGNGLLVQHAFGGSTVKGGRQGISSTLFLTAATNSVNANRNYVGIAGSAQTATGDGGTGLTAATGKGAFFCDWVVENRRYQRAQRYRRRVQRVHGNGDISRFQKPHSDFRSCWRRCARQCDRHHGLGL